MGPPATSGPPATGQPGLTDDVTIVGANITVNLNVNANVASLVLNTDGGGLNGGSSLSVSSGFTWYAGKLSGPGFVTIDGTSTFAGGAGRLDLDGRTLTNFGTVNWVSGGIKIVNANIVNQTDAIFDAQTDRELEHGINAKFVNHGRFVKSDTDTIDETTTIGTIDNYGIGLIGGVIERGVVVTSGTLVLGGGGRQEGFFQTAVATRMRVLGGGFDFECYTGTQFAGASPIEIDNFAVIKIPRDEEVYNTGAMRFITGTIKESGAGALDLVFYQWGDFEWAGGEINMILFINDTIGSDALTITGNVSMDGAVLQNFGTLSWFAGDITLKDTQDICCLYNAGAWEIDCDNEIAYDNTGGNGAFVWNAYYSPSNLTGHITKTGGGGNDLNILLLNDGVIDLNALTINFLSLINNGTINP